MKKYNKKRAILPKNLPTPVLYLITFSLTKTETSLLQALLDDNLLDIFLKSKL